ncbi:Ivy family c-type lysozyme inhibitor [Pseudomonas bohemica]|uniref:Ivy family c-type lysozyme inhibitor n=1 Tax=Pseudomonas bohemica TaxID=2044872 RepID=UPI000DA613BA|nr:Ivy family c-type lysozyme inhibitor [Pseudomonas bohemica]
MSKLCFSALVAVPMVLIATVASADQYLPEIASKAPYKKAYTEMLAFPDWVAKARGTATPVEKVSVDGKDFTVGHMCKPHDCADNQLIVVFSGDGKKSWGLIATRKAEAKGFNKYLLGDPDSVVEGLLNKAFSDHNPDE